MRPGADDDEAEAAGMASALLPRDSCSCRDERAGFRERARSRRCARRVTPSRKLYVNSSIKTIGKASAEDGR
jgi:hypothetical protein